LNKLEKLPLIEYETAFYSYLALRVLEKKIFREFAVLTGFWLKCDLEMMVKSRT
jgi:hypothetical protein